MNHYRITDIQIGLTEQFSTVITDDMMASFQKITGDTSPIHISETNAKNKGFNDRVVYGLLTASFYSTLVGVHLPGEFAVLSSLDITFSNPVYINDTLTISGEVKEIDTQFNLIKLKVKITNQNGELVSRGTIRVGFRE